MSVPKRKWQKHLRLNILEKMWLAKCTIELREWVTFIPAYEPNHHSRVACYTTAAVVS